MRRALEHIWVPVTPTFSRGVGGVGLAQGCRYRYVFDRGFVPTEIQDCKMRGFCSWKLPSPAANIPVHTSRLVVRMACSDTVAINTTHLVLPMPGRAAETGFSLAEGPGNLGLLVRPVMVSGSNRPQPGHQSPAHGPERYLAPRMLGCGLRHSKL